MKQQRTQRAEPDGERQKYKKPRIERVDLALVETLSSGCKLADTACDDPFDPGAGEPGS